MKNIRFLIVEDNDHYRNFLKNIIQEDFSDITEIEEAADGREALEKVDSFIPDLIFMDIRLPDENGLELTRKIKAARPDTDIVILTYYDLPEYREAAFRYGANAFLVKDCLHTSIGNIISFMN